MKNINGLKHAAVLLTLLTGCESARENMRKQAERDAFPPEDDSRSYRRFAMAQEAVGARHDGMLYSYHFDGDHLNSLGERKLCSMLRDNDHAFPVVVYMNFADESRQKPRQDAVSVFMMDLSKVQPMTSAKADPTKQFLNSSDCCS